MNVFFHTYEMYIINKLYLMSLFVIGSVSRVTTNLINLLSKHALYTSVTIADPLPIYNFHHRYYRLQKQLENSSTKLNVILTRLTSEEDIKRSQFFNDVLYITHDYYLNVISKTKLMELTANICKNRKNLYFATPAQYDHAGYTNPQGTYTESEKKVLQANPNSTIIRSDIQDNTQILYALKSSGKAKPPNFTPNPISGTAFSSIVFDTLSQRIQGKKLLVRENGQGQHHGQINYTQFEPIQYEHALENMLELASKYNEYHFEGYERVEKKSQVQGKTN